MANSYSRVFIHLVFSPKYRASKLNPAWKKELHAFIGGVLKNNGHIPLAVNSMPDHIHIFHIHNPKQSISDLVRNLKIASNQWINSRPDVHQEFKWQIGYGVFSHSHAQKETVINYVLNQEEHHQKGSFKKEYTSILRRNGIDYDPQYLFDFFEGED